MEKNGPNYVACLCELIDLKGFVVEHDMEPDSRRLKELVAFQGAGWYSYDDERKMFRKGEFATFCRIRITETD